MKHKDKTEDPQKAWHTHHKSITSLIGASWSYLPSPVYDKVMIISYPLMHH